ncbi:tetratricopeptide repeat protein [Aquisalibacillus elongatus]|uniref:Tetratricopeptide repeat protein n=1 Tax=Aquisalibacillus elongatus TaxID=485577 RepID=A0A3N5B7F0_9BACI|nr:tetratricopeptide repeat protein [Aquisalibacillus elongatus]RPF53364.1 tetratricopeptide repeat protein [Aquisalibacillus elongatus]
MGRIREQLEKLNDQLYFDETDFLREKVGDPKLVDELITQVRRELMVSEAQDERCFLYGTLGNLYRLQGNLEKSIDCLKEALKIAASDSAREIVMRIRLGETYKYHQDYQKALDQFELAELIGLEYEPQYLDFAYQHKGKCLMEMGMYNEAKEAFENAHAIRKGKKDEKLIQSTEKAMELLDQLVESE